MPNDRAILEAIQRAAGVKDFARIVAATVQSVDVDKRVCVVTTITGTSEIDIPGVQLMAGVNDGFMLVPKVGSMVYVGYSIKNLPFINMFSAVDKVFLVCDNVLMNDGSFGGLVKATTLTTKLNNLEDKVNSIISTFNSHTHMVTVSSLGTPTPTVAPTSPISGTLTPTEQTEIENNKFKHG